MHLIKVLHCSIILISITSGVTKETDIRDVCASKPYNNSNTGEESSLPEIDWGNIPDGIKLRHTQIYIEDNCVLKLYTLTNFWIPSFGSLAQPTCHSNIKNSTEKSILFEIIKVQATTPNLNYPFPIDWWYDNGAVFELVLSSFHGNVRTEVNCTIVFGFARFFISLGIDIPGCPNGYYGEMCNNTCHCEHGGYCHTFYGYCLCPEGWNGDLCQIYEPYIEVDSSSANDIYINDNVTMECQAYPKNVQYVKTYRWQLNTTILEINSSVHTLTVQDDVSGTYTCVAEDWNGTVYSANFILHNKGCRPNFYGPNCQYTCDCAQEELCLRETGCTIIPPNTTSSDDPGTTTQPFPAGYLVAIIVIGIALLVLLILVVVMCVRYRYRLQQSSSGAQFKPDYLYMDYIKRLEETMGTSGSVPYTDEDQCEYLLKKWNISDNDLFLGSVIGEGEFSRVLEAHFRWKNNLWNVAVKMVKDSSDTQARNDIIAEFQILAELCPHDNVVELMGICSKNIEGNVKQCLVVEFMCNGNLLRFLRNIRNDDSDYLTPVKPKQFSKFAVDILAGMTYLASKKVVHRDLAARNILLSSAMVAKIGDFGLSRDIYLSGNYKTADAAGKRLPWYWMAYESLETSTYSTKSDVWSFGILLWEICTLGATPYPGVDPADLLSKLQSGYRMAKPAAASKEWYLAMHQCWLQNPDLRPDFAEMLHTFKGYLHTKKNYVTFEPKDKPETVENGNKFSNSTHDAAQVNDSDVGESTLL